MTTVKFSKHFPGNEFEPCEVSFKTFDAAHVFFQALHIVKETGKFCIDSDRGMQYSVTRIEIISN